MQLVLQLELGVGLEGAYVDVVVVSSGAIVQLPLSSSFDAAQVLEDLVLRRWVER